MKIKVTIDLISKYGKCPVCGSDKVGNGNILETFNNCSELKASMNE